MSTSEAINPQHTGDRLRNCKVHKRAQLNKGNNGSRRVSSENLLFQLKQRGLNCGAADKASRRFVIIIFSSSNWQIFTQLSLGPLGTVSRSLTKKTFVQEAEREVITEQSLQGPRIENRHYSQFKVTRGFYPRSFPTNYTSRGGSHPQRVIRCGKRTRFTSCRDQ